MKADVFISYKSEDIADANFVKEALTRQGIRCWMAPGSIPGGSNYAKEIPKAIRACKVFVLLLSKKAQRSKWVSRELDRALNEEKIVMPFLLENCPLIDDFNFYLTNVQQYNAYEDKNAALQKMISEIRQALGMPDVPTEETTPKKDPVPTTDGWKTKLRSKPVVLAAAILGAALLIGLLAGVLLPAVSKWKDRPPHDDDQTVLRDADDAEKILGVWECTLNVGGEIRNGLLAGTGSDDTVDPVYLPLRVTFLKNGSVEIAADASSDETAAAVIAAQDGLFNSRWHYKTDAGRLYLWGDGGADGGFYVNYLLPDSQRLYLTGAVGDGSVEAEILVGLLPLKLTKAD